MSTINREAAIRNLTAIIIQQEGKPLIHWEEVRKMLETMPEAQPERKKGYWIDVDPHGDSGLAFECSECGEINLRESDYCPNCGSYMKGE